MTGLQSIGLGNPYDINNSGTVVGGGGLIWDAINGTRSLVDLIPSDAGWQLDFAFGINNAGQIVGVGQLDGETHAFLLSPVPEPTGISLTCLAFSISCFVYRLRSP